MSVWLEAARPKTLPASVVPVLVGTAASGRFIAWRAFAALLVAVGMQVGVNYANDLFDAARGIDTEERVGPRRVTAAGLVTPRQMRFAIAIALATAVLAGLALTIAVGPELLLVGAASVTAALTYSGGPRPYASAGLGELFVFVFFGLIATVGSSYVQIDGIDDVAVAAAVPVGLLATAILVVNNLRDRATDRAAGKMTLAVRLGESRTRALVVALVAGAFLSCLSLVWLGPDPHDGIVPLAAALPAAVVVRGVVSARAPEGLVASVGALGKVHLLFGLLVAGALWI